MSARLHALLLLAALTDDQAQRDPVDPRAPQCGWVTRCLHCRSRVGVGLDGQPWPGTTLEHIVPRAWFGKRAAAALCAGLDSADDPRNLALACARCNHAKGRSHDANGPGDARALAVVLQLRAARLARWRPPPGRAGI